jgi:hypothetical protein
VGSTAGATATAGALAGAAGTDDPRVITTMAATIAVALATETTGHQKPMRLDAGASAMRARTPAAKPGDGATSSDAPKSDNS